MDLLSWRSPSLLLTILSLLLSPQGSLGSSFTFVNKCEYTVWPGILANAGSPKLDSTGFELPRDTSRTFQAPTGWSGRFWARTGCNFDGSGPGSCQTGDCGSGEVECNGNGAAPPATLAEFTLGTGGQDFYDVSLVDGYNLPMIIEGSGGSGSCAPTGCTADLNSQCPTELKAESGGACKSACEAFGTPEYCCSGAYGSPSTCKPSIYSEMFKAACPRSYSYAFDDPTSTFTCTGADYTVTFCPSSPSQKSSRDTTPVTPSQGQQQQQQQGTVPQTGSGYPGMVYGTGAGTQLEMGYPGGVYGSGTQYGSGSQYGSGYQGAGAVYGSGSGAQYGSQAQTGSGETMLADGSWLAGLAMGDSSRTHTAAWGVEAVLIGLATLLPVIFSFNYL